MLSNLTASVEIVARVGQMACDPRVGLVVPLPAAVGQDPAAVDLVVLVSRGDLGVAPSSFGRGLG